MKTLKKLKQKVLNKLPRYKRRKNNICHWQDLNAEKPEDTDAFRTKKKLNTLTRLERRKNEPSDHNQRKTKLLARLECRETDREV